MGGNIAVNVPIPSIPSSGKLVACNPKSMKQTLLLTYFNLVTLLSYIKYQALNISQTFRKFDNSCTYKVVQLVIIAWLFHSPKPQSCELAITISVIIV